MRPCRLLVVALAVLAQAAPAQRRDGFTGSSGCRDCHQRFYQKWSGSHHGLAMQPFSEQLGKTELAPQRHPIRIGNRQYQVRFAGAEAWVEERGPQGSRKFPIRYLLGGKNTYYFLTPLERGRLQVLPLAWDVAKKRWYDTTASAVRRHGDPSQEPLHWRDPEYTFNTSCYGCHVSQLKTNYDSSTDSYRTTWTEPGINCETCHGPGEQHVAHYRQASVTAPQADPEIIRFARFGHNEKNESCAPCHAKITPIGDSWKPGARFFDHYDIATLEDADFYPDGRDRGENYTYTGWLMNPCARSGQLDCIHCHTSSGRYRFARDNPNGACLPCHRDKAENLEAHSHHSAAGPAGTCISCHMPKTRFANMNRSDHSFLPPAPAATVRFQSPNACNLCHTGQNASWADGWVRKWHARDYQGPVLERAALVDAARHHDWTQLPDILTYLARADKDIVTAASLIRLLRACEDRRKLPGLVRALDDPEPLVRAAAADALAGDAEPDAISALMRATRDDYRLVRVRAAGSLAGLDTADLDEHAKPGFVSATRELLASLTARPDDFASRTSLGNYHLDRGELKEAIAAYEAALRLRPNSIATMVNASLAYNRAGRNAEAERVLREALRQSPRNVEAGTNLGLLLAETGRNAEAETVLQNVVDADPSAASAAYNLCVLEAKARPANALANCRAAVRAQPQNERYGLALAFYLQRQGDRAGAVQTLENLLRANPRATRAAYSLGEILLEGGNREQAAEVWQRILNLPELPADVRARITQRLQQLNP